MPFGGAGPLHAAALAGELGISRVLCPPHRGVLCALGLAAAAPRRDVSRTVMLDAAHPAGRASGAQSAALLIAAGQRRARRSHPYACACATSCATAASPSSWQSMRSSPAPRARALAHAALRRLRPRARAALRLPRRVRRDRARHHARVRLGRCARAATARSAAPRRPPPRVRPIVFAGEAMAAAVHRGEPRARQRAARPRACRAARRHRC